MSRSFKATPDRDSWLSLCPPNEFRVITALEARNAGIIPAGMNDVNSVIIGASGSIDQTLMFFANYCRIDHQEIDQEPYFELYESGSQSPTIHGILHHADFQGRTETLTSEQIARISASGSSVSIQFTALPGQPSGSLEELKAQGKLDGFNYAWDQGMKRK